MVAREQNIGEEPQREKERDDLQRHTAVTHIKASHLIIPHSVDISGLIH